LIKRPRRFRDIVDQPPAGAKPPFHCGAPIAHSAAMNDASEPARHQLAIVRPRDAASLILLRGEGRDLEVLAGRRPVHVKFMPGVYVFPGGAVAPEDPRPWPGEKPGTHLPPRLVRCARAALRETWEEVGVVVGRPARADCAAAPGLGPVERAY